MWAAAALIVLVGCDQPEDDFVFKVGPDLTANEAAAVQQALEIFQRECPLIFTYWSDVEHASARTVDHKRSGGLQWFYRYEFWGWTYEVEIVVKIVDDPRRIPNSFRARRHTLTYYLGGGHTPGITTHKEQGKRMCPMPLNTEEANIKPVADLAFLNSL